MSPNVRLLIGIPTMGSVHPMLASRLIRWGREFAPGQVHFYFTFKVAPVDRARNQVAKFFMTKKTPEGEEFTHLLFIDSDTIPPEDAITRLLSHDKEIVTGLTPILSYDENDGSWDTYDNCFTHTDRNAEGKVEKTHIAQRGTGLQEVFRCGAACLLVARTAFEKMPMPYFKFVTNAEGTAHSASEDIYFCDQARLCGLTIYADTDVACQHYKDIMI